MTSEKSTSAVRAAMLALAVALPLGTLAIQAADAQMTAPAAALSQETVRALQDALNKQGINVAVDGILGDATRTAIREYQSQHHLPVTGEPDKETLNKLGMATPQASNSVQQQEPAQHAKSDPNAGAMGPGNMGGMMQMMHQMMGGNIMGGAAGPSGSMRMSGMGPQSGSMGMERPDALSGMPRGQMSALPGLIYGAPTGEFTAERVKDIVAGMLAWHGNPRLKLGTVVGAGDDIVAEIVTQDGSLVQKLAFSRALGNVRQVP